MLSFKTTYDTLTTNPERGPEFYLKRHLRRKGLRQGTGDGRLGRLRETDRYKHASIADVISDRLDRCITSEFRFYEWNVLTMCAYCLDRLSKRTVTRDHVVPQSKGGPTTPDNLVPCCSRCNRRKADKPLWQIQLLYLQMERWLTLRINRQVMLAVIGNLVMAIRLLIRILHINIQLQTITQ